MGIHLSHFHWEYYGNGEGIGVAFQLYVKSVHFPFPSVGCSVFHVGGDSFLKRERFTSGTQSGPEKHRTNSNTLSSVAASGGCEVVWSHRAATSMDGI